MNIMSILARFLLHNQKSRHEISTSVDRGFQIIVELNGEINAFFVVYPSFLKLNSQVV